MDTELYGGSFILSWREHLDIKSRRQSLSKEEKALRRLITVKEQFQSENALLKEKIVQVKKLQAHYKSIGFCSTARRIEQVLKE